MNTVVKNILTGVFAIICCVSLFSCGGTHTVEIVDTLPDTIDIIHSVDFEEFEQAFINECEKQYSTPEEVDLCVQGKIREFIKFLEQINTDKGESV